MKIDFKPVHFKEAIEFFKSKIRIPTRHYTDLIQEEHVRGFMVAGAMCDDLLTDFQKALADAKEKSTPLSEFRKRFDQIVEKHGWGYNGSRGWRSKLIYNVNLRMANAAGRWAQIQRTKTRRPWLRYVATLDDRNLAHRVPRQSKVSANLLDRFALNEKCAPDLRNRFHNQHPQSAPKYLLGSI